MRGESAICPPTLSSVPNPANGGLVYDGVPHAAFQETLNNAAIKGAVSFTRRGKG